VTVSPSQRKVKPNGKNRMNLRASPQARAVAYEPDRARENADLAGDAARGHGSQLPLALSVFFC
jgi:hypothetical protein